ncbi:hypothetical protein ACFVZD_45025 [Streptomyces sp. NPDC058287]|uniref:hypothetical protein n=1 Tax=unclassified Streptomyces TaxID=2593676 RepID=UPI0036E5D371
MDPRKDAEVFTALEGLVRHAGQKGWGQTNSEHRRATDALVIHTDEIGPYEADGFADVTFGDPKVGKLGCASSSFRSAHTTGRIRPCHVSRVDTGL